MTLRSAKLLVPSCVLGLVLAACNGGGDGGGEAGASGSGGAGVGGQPGGTGGVTGAGGKTGAGGMQGAGGVTATGGAGGASTSDPLIGWASQGCTVGAVTTTTGGGTTTAMAVTTLSALNSAAAGATARVIQFSGSLSGTLTVGSNKTIIGAPGAKITGHVSLGHSVNVILQNFTVVGLNCSDVPANGDCQDGADAVTVNGSSNHIWIDHLDVSDGSDGNLDVTDGSDCVTISWTKFHYSASRVAGYTGEVHHFSNLVGGDDAATGDTGHLRITWHHDWWADHVVERQPRVRFGQNHIFNNLWTSSGDNYCVAAAVNSNVLVENNAFVNVRDTMDTTNYSNAATIALARNNMYSGTAAATANKGTGVFTPPYPYTPDDPSTVQAAVTAGAGPH